MLMSALLVKASIVIKERERLFLVKMEVNYKSEIFSKRVVKGKSPIGTFISR